MNIVLVDRPPRWGHTALGLIRTVQARWRRDRCHDYPLATATVAVDGRDVQVRRLRLGETSEGAAFVVRTADGAEWVPVAEVV